MNFLQLNIENFLSIGKASIDLENKGLVLVQGQNEDDTSANSNGVGKSSIADALCWALFGETARGVSGDAVINDVAKKGTEVSVCVEDDEAQYVITRYRKHPKGKNSLTVVQEAEPGEEVDLTKGTDKETQLEVNRILGCSQDVFMTAIYAGQELMPDLPRLTDKQLKVLIEEAAGITVLERAYEAARSAMTQSKIALNEANAQRETLAERVNNALDFVKTLKTQREQFEATRAERVTGYKQQAVRIIEEIKELRTQASAIPVQEYRDRVYQIQVQIGKGKSLALEAESFARREQSASQALASGVARLEASMRAVNAQKQLIETLPGSVGKPCGSCGKPHTEEDMKVVLRNANMKLDILNDEFAGVKEDVTDLKRSHAEAVAAAAEAKAQVPDYSALYEEMQAKSQQITQFERLEEQIATKKREGEQAVAAANEAQSEPFPSETELRDRLNRLLLAKDDLQQCEELVKKAQFDLEVAEDVCKVYSPAGVRAQVLDTVTPFLNERTSEYLTLLSDGNITAVWQTLGETTKGELREKFNIEVENSKGAKQYAGLSGGEKRKVRLATMLALQDLVSSRAHKPIRLWVGDEIDDALDTSGLERLMSILERKAREKGTVLIISHNDLSDWADQVAVVIKKDGVSTIEGALTV